VAAIHYQFRSKSILSYYKRTEKTKFRTERRQRSIDNFKRQETYSGQVTDGSAKRLTRALENLLQVAEWKFFEHDGKTYPFKVNCVTLTVYSFGRRVPGREAHKTLLEPFLRWLRRDYGMSAYVWKAELQTKRKDCMQIHYHLTTDVFIPHKVLREKWNELQRNAHYLDYFFEKFGHWNANSTDVHAVHNKKKLIGYLKKIMVRYSDKKKYQHLKNRVIAEMAKTEQNKINIEGKVWDCSLNLKVAYYECIGYGDITHQLAQMVITKDVEKIESERCTVYAYKKEYLHAELFIPWPEQYFYHDRIQKMRTFQRLKPDIKTFSSS
jgi:hypothetical protein